MAVNKKAAGAGARTASTTRFVDPDQSIDPLVGWFNLAKPSRNFQPKKAWKRGQK